jgi:hypothetical protein
MNSVPQKEIVVEIERLQIVRKRAKTHMSFCSGCRANSDFVSIREAASLFDTHETSLVNFVTANNCHSHLEVAELHICLVSLLAVFRRSDRRPGLKLQGE